MDDTPMAVTGWRCATCGAEVPVATPLSFRCPNATATDRYHVLQIVSGPRVDPPERQANTFVTDDQNLAWAAFAESHGMARARRNELIEELDAAIRDVDGASFVATPFARSDVLSDELGMSARGGIWVKDETGGVGGSQKARFLFSILLHLRAAQELGLLADRPPLAIASCGNAALAAATLAKAAEWPLDVYVPTWMGDGLGDRLDELGARVHRSERRNDDPAGDPAMLRFRDAIAEGAVPFTVQGPENALCLDGGRTLGWEVCEQAAAAGIAQIDRVFIQVGGGAFAAAVGGAMNDVCGPVSLFAVQAEGCAPFERAWRRSKGIERPAENWAQIMTVWDGPSSLADGILDDETYDWIGVLEAVRSSGGRPVIATEDQVREAHALTHRAGFEASPTGTAGLAGILAARTEIGDDEQIVVVMSGVTR